MASACKGTQMPVHTPVHRWAKADLHKLTAAHLTSQAHAVCGGFYQSLLAGCLAALPRQLQLGYVLGVAGQLFGCM